MYKYTLSHPLYKIASCISVYSLNMSCCMLRLLVLVYFVSLSITNILMIISIGPTGGQRWCGGGGGGGGGGDSGGI